MKKFEIITTYNTFSTSTLIRDVERLINIKSNEGFEIVSVSFGVNIWWIPTAYITVCK